MPEINTNAEDTIAMHSLDQTVLSRAESDPYRVFMIDGIRSLTFSELEQLSRARAIHFAKLGARIGTHIAVVGSNTLESVVAICAVLRTGATVDMLAGEISAAELRSELTQREPLAVIAPQPTLDALREEVARVGSDHRQWIPIPLDARFDRARGFPFQELAGVTAATDVSSIAAGARARSVAIHTASLHGDAVHPSVELAHGVVTRCAHEFADTLELDAHDVISLALPITRIDGFLALFAAIGAGSKVVLERACAYPFELLRRIEIYQSTVLPTDAAMLARIIALLPVASIDVGSVRCVTIDAMATSTRTANIPRDQVSACLAIDVSRFQALFSHAKLVWPPLSIVQSARSVRELASTR